MPTYRVDNLAMGDEERSQLLLPAQIDSNQPAVSRKFDVKSILSWIGFIVACFDKLCAGTIFAATVYLNDLKRTYNYTQTEVEVIVSALNVGVGCAVFPGMCFDRFGPTIPCCIALVLTTGSYLLVWHSTTVVEFYRSKCELIALYFFLSGFGIGFTFVASQNTSIVNFSSEWRGKLIGIQDAMFTVSPLLISPIYYHLFSYRTSSYTYDYDFAGFMLFLAILFGTNSLLCLIFSRYYRNGDVSTSSSKAETMAILSLPETKSADDSPSLTLCDASAKDKTHQNVDAENEDASLWQVLQSGTFHFYMWTFALMVCVDFVCVNNLTIATKALGFDKYNFIVVMSVSGFMFVCSLTTGIVVDRFRSHRGFVQLIASVAATIALLFYCLGGNVFAIFLSASCLVGIPTGIMWVSVPTEISERFHIKHFGRNWGFIRLVQISLNSIVQYAYGYLYQMNLPAGDIYCYGLHCVRYGYFLLMFLTVASFFVFIKHYWGFWRRRS